MILFRRVHLVAFAIVHAEVVRDCTQIWRPSVHPQNDFLQYDLLLTGTNQSKEIRNLNLVCNRESDLEGDSPTFVKARYILCVPESLTSQAIPQKLASGFCPNDSLSTISIAFGLQ